MLHKLKFQCSNFKNGCNEQIMYSNIISHSADCIFKKISCDFESEGCSDKFLLKDKLIHLQKC